MIRLIFITFALSLGLMACDKQATANNTNAQHTNNAEVQSVADVKQTEPAAPTNEIKQAATQARSFGPELYKEGVHYKRLAATVAKFNPEKAEVVEVFWYGCIHCFNFEPIVKSWKKNKSAGVEFVAVPVVWNERTNLHAKMFYTVEQLGLTETLHDAIFRAMNQQKKTLSSLDSIAEFFESNGVQRSKFTAAFNSFSVTSKAAAAAAKSKEYAIEGTPEVIVNGKYRTSARMAGSQDNIFKVVDYLLALDK